MRLRLKLASLPVPFSVSMSKNGHSCNLLAATSLLSIVIKVVVGRYVSPISRVLHPAMPATNHHSADDWFAEYGKVAE